jgi:hypothetical protein
MAKRNRTTTEKSIKKRIREGRGQGQGSDYKPWLHIQDVPSLGLVTRIKGWKTERVHHYLSLVELRYFYVLEWSLDVVDIREQYPLLPLEDTLEIAKECGVIHPRDPKTKQPIVMTTDFLNTVRQGAVERDSARAIKCADALSSKRTMEKLEIERRYWEAKKVDWKIVTDGDIPKALAKNVEWVHQYRRLEDFSNLSDTAITQIVAALTKGVTTINAPLRDITLQTDDKLGLEVGTSLSIVRNLIANRRWRVNMNEPINPCARLMLIADPRN